MFQWESGANSAKVLKVVVNLGLLLKQKFVMDYAEFVSSDGRDEVSAGFLEL